MVGCVVLGGWKLEKMMENDGVGELLVAANEEEKR